MTESARPVRPVSVVIVDDHAMFRAGVRAELAGAGAGEVDVVAEAADVPQAVAAIREHQPHVVLLDVYGAREAPMDGISSALVGDPLRELPGERTVVVGASPAEAVAEVVAAARPGDLVLTVGAGDVTRLGPLLLDALAALTAKGAAGSATERGLTDSTDPTGSTDPDGGAR